jgi:hypothetical protein
MRNLEKVYFFEKFSLKISPLTFRFPYTGTASGLIKLAKIILIQTQKKNKKTKSFLQNKNPK